MADIDVRIRQRSVIEFLNAEGETPIGIHGRLKNVYGDATVDVSTVRRCRLKRVRPTKTVLLLHDNARPHTSRHTTEEIEKIGWEVLPHPPYSPDLAPSDFHLFGPLKDAHRGVHFEDEEAVKISVRQWLRKQNPAFYRTGMHALVKRWTKTVEMDGDYIEK